MGRAQDKEAWWNYNGGRFRQEVALAKSLHANCIRLWIEFTAWMADPDRVTERFLDAVKAIDEQGMKTMPVLFNRWHDSKWDYGGQYIDDLGRDWGPKLEYVRALVKPLATDPRVLIWDLCNEPNAFNLNEDWSRREFEFLKQVAAATQRAGATADHDGYDGWREHRGVCPAVRCALFSPIHPHASRAAGTNRKL